ncbi:MAG: 3-deoxy-D-manno-octulosonic acid transferase [Dissulfurimicrobium sp.]|uniref:3-deoxy-D-manno-octulosonic acid transferase n=1 Tax=Dissulfurimicrobium sp. TaxID=2022436 RepID=UPI00404A6534
MLFLYNILLVLFLPIVALPVLVFMGLKDKYRSQLNGRLGIGLNIEALKGKRPRIWVHALSLGEANAAVPFVKMVAKRWPKAGIICSASTKTGLTAIKNALTGTAHTIMPMPFDLLPLVARVIRRLSPDCLVLVETDLWPNLIWALRRKGIPVLLINGSISSRAQKRLKLLGKAFTNLIYGGLSHIAMQSEMDCLRLLELGLPKDRVIAAGNIKYDIKCEKTTDAIGSSDKKSWAWMSRPNEDGAVFVAGSTHKGEEAVILPTFKTLKKEFPALKLVIAPRNPTRGKEIAAMAKKLGLIANKRSAGFGLEEADILILDTLGELKGYYLAADIAFVGGSLVNAGGHNILEPAACGTPVIFGPNIESFRYAADELLSDGAGLCVRDATGLEDALRTLLQDKGRRMEMGRRAKALIARNSGATMRYIRLLEKYIKETA